MRIVDWNDLVQKSPRADAELYASFQRCGSALISGLPMARAEIERAAALQAEVFSLPPERKRQLCPTDGTARSGLIPFMTEIANGGQPPDPKEVWHISREPYVSNIWVEELPEFESAMKWLWARSAECCAVIMHSLGRSLGDEGYVREIMIEQNSVLRSVRYSSGAGSERQEVLAGQHRDVGLLTMHLHTSHSGYEYWNEGIWHALPQDPDLALVNAGDMLTHISNGKIKASTHRVLNPFTQDEKRLFIGMFVHPHTRSWLRSLTQGEPAQFQDRLSMDVLLDRGREIKIF